MISKEELDGDNKLNQNLRLKSLDDIHNELSDIIKTANKEKDDTEISLKQFTTDV